MNIAAEVVEVMPNADGLTKRVIARFSDSSGPIGELVINIPNDETTIDVSSIVIGT